VEPLQDGRYPIARSLRLTFTFRRTAMRPSQHAIYTDTNNNPHVL
jgi:hypothetical protein